MPDETKTAETTTQAAAVEKAQEQISKSISQGGAPTEVTLPDGQKFTASTPQELMQKLADAKYHANEHVKKVEEEAKAAREEAARATAEMAQLRKSLGQAINPQEQTPTYDHNTYLNLLAKDGLEALNYVKKFDPEYQQLRQQAAVSQQALLTQAFLGRNSDFSGSPEDSKKLVDLVQKTGLDMTNIQHLEMAKSYLKDKGEITVPAKEKASAPPPFIPSGGYAQPTNAEHALAEQIANAPDAKTARELVERASMA